MKIAIVILNWNGKALLGQFLPFIVRYSEGAEIWVADNASTDGSVAFVQSAFPEVKLVRNESNLGFAGGYNEALKSIEADIFVLVNSDIEVTPNWLPPILSVFEKEPETAIIQPKILDFKRRDHFEYAGAAGGFLDQYGYPFCRGRLFDTIEKDDGQYDDDCEIFWASGACFFIRSSVFKNLGGFDPGFFAHQEEIDLCWRAFNAGHAAKYVSASTVFHVGGATLSEGSPKKTLLNFRNSLLMLHKNVPQRDRFRIVFIRLCLDGVAGIRFLTQGHFDLCFAIVKAHMGFFKMLRKNQIKRLSLPKSNYFKIKSILYPYFIQRKKRYSDLF